MREVFETNFFGALAMLQAAGREMARRGGGSIINVTSRLASIGVPWSCTADYYYDGPWSFLCIRRGTYGQVSVDRFRELSQAAAGS